MAEAIQSTRGTDPAPSSGPWASLAALALLLAFVGLGVRFMVSERAARLAKMEPAEVALRDYVIPPGRESAVRELLTTIESGALPGITQYSFSIQKSDIRVQLFGDSGGACQGPGWVADPGALVLSRGPPDPAELSSPSSGSAHDQTLWVTWHWCGGANSEAREAAVTRLAKELSTQPQLDEIWQAIGAEPEPPPEIPRQSGMLTPAVELTGLDHEQLTICALLLGVLLTAVVATLLGPRLPGPSPHPIRAHPPRWLWAAAALLLLVSAGLRVDLGIERVLDTDENWAYALGGSIFAENHDPWVHPPLFHLLQQPWIRALGWQPGDGALLLRAPSIALGLLATGLSVTYVSARARSPWIAALALPIALAPALASTLVIARPYALAAALVVICAMALWPIPPATQEHPWAARARWWLILLAAGLAAWTDVIAGAAAITLILGRLASGSRAQRRSNLGAKLCVVIVLAAWVLPLVPGSLQAAEFQLDPELTQATLDTLGISRPADVRPDPDLTSRLPAFCVFGIDRVLWPLGLLALALAATLAALGWRRPEHRMEAALPLLMIVIWVVVASQLVHLRARNVAFAPHLIAMLAALVLAGWRRPPKT